MATSLQVEAIAAAQPMIRRLKYRATHDAQREMAKHLAGTNWALRATNAQMKAGAKTLLAMAGASNRAETRRD